MKMRVTMFEKRIRCQVSIDGMQFGFMPGKGTDDSIFMVRQDHESNQSCIESTAGCWYSGCCLQ